jgi:chromosome segregation ATPase
MNPPDQPCQATPTGDLRQQILDSRVPKNEREWWASREIEKLERELTAASQAYECAMAIHGTVMEERDRLAAELAAAKAECERSKFALVEWEAKERGWSKAVEKDAAELARLRAEVERLKAPRSLFVSAGIYEDALARAEKAEAERDALAKELGNIANAKPATWGDMSDSFQAWAQNRARHALAAMKGTI